MIPEANKTDIVQSGLNFMRAITEAYGTDEGMKLWDTIADSIDPDVKGKIFFAMLTGEYNDRIILTSVMPNANKVAVIKAIRYATGLGLKEAKDLSDNLFYGQRITLIVDPKNRVAHINDLRSAGCIL